MTKNSEPPVIPAISADDPAICLLPKPGDAPGGRPLDALARHLGQKGLAGMSAGPGWAAVIGLAAIAAERSCRPLKVKIAWYGAKEKFGRLSAALGPEDKALFTDGGYPAELRKALRASRSVLSLSSLVCQGCGAPAALSVSGGWWNTLCPSCRAAYESNTEMSSHLVSVPGVFSAVAASVLQQVFSSLTDGGGSPVTEEERSAAACSALEAVAPLSHLASGPEGGGFTALHRAFDSRFCVGLLSMTGVDPMASFAGGPAPFDTWGSLSGKFAAKTEALIISSGMAEPASAARPPRI